MLDSDQLPLDERGRADEHGPFGVGALYGVPYAGDAPYAVPYTGEPYDPDGPYGPYGPAAAYGEPGAFGVPAGAGVPAQLAPARMPLVI